MNYDNTNSGALFKNTDKPTDKHPDYGGSVNVEGAEYWLNGWIKEGKTGKFISLSLKPKEAKAKPAPQHPPVHFNDINQDIPF